MASPVPLAAPVVNNSSNRRTAVEIIGTAIRDLLTPAPVAAPVAVPMASPVAAPVAVPVAAPVAVPMASPMAAPINQTPGNILSAALASRGQSGGTRSRRKRKWDSKKRKN
jgi:hypothetical protein